MRRAHAGIRRFTSDDALTWYQAGDRRIFLGDVLDPSTSDTMSVGFARYAPGERNRWVVTYDEALVVTMGAFTVTADNGPAATAQAGEVIFLTAGTTVVYAAEDTGAEVVYVTYPHWQDAQRQSPHAALLDGFHPVQGAPPRAAPADGNVSRLREIWGPMERGESGDPRAFFDALADDVVLRNSLGELRGKQAVVDYFAAAAATIDFQPFERPLEYFADGDRVVILGAETFRVKESGATHHADWAWVVDLRGGLITRILSIQDLSGVAGAVAEAMATARSGDR